MSSKASVITAIISGSIGGSEVLTGAPLEVDGGSDMAVGTVSALGSGAEVMNMGVSEVGSGSKVGMVSPLGTTSLLVEAAGASEHCSSWEVSICPPVLSLTPVLNKNWRPGP